MRAETLQIMPNQVKTIRGSFFRIEPHGAGQVVWVSFDAAFQKHPTMATAYRIAQNNPFQFECKNGAQDLHVWNPSTESSGGDTIGVSVLTEDRS